MLVRQGYAVITRNNPPAPADLSVTGLCFQPKALMVFPVQSNAPGNFETPGGFRPPAAHFSNSFVAAVGSDYGQTSHWDAGQVAYGEEDATNLGGFPVQAPLVSYDADGFTLHFPFISTYYFYWIAFGGDSLETYASSFAVPGSPSTAPIVVTGVGFQPDFLFAMTEHDLGFQVSASVCMGMASGPSNQAAVSASMGVFGTRTHTLLNGYLTCPKDAFYGNYNQTQLASFDPDGFTVNVVLNSITDPAANLVRYLAIKDPESQFSVGVDTQGTGPTATTGVGFPPSSGLFLGSFKTVDNDLTYNTSPDGVPMLSVGAADGLLNQAVLTEFNQSGGFGGHDQNAYSDIDAVLAIGQATPLQLNARGELASWDADGFTLDWTISDSVARYFVYGVFQADPVDPCEWTPIIYRWLHR